MPVQFLGCTELAAARLNQIPVVFSEDFSDGPVVEGVRFANPFCAGFRIEAWFAAIG
jgi:hypothetical protein